jgi:hypothetical protein
VPAHNERDGAGCVTIGHPGSEEGTPPRQPAPPSSPSSCSSRSGAHGVARTARQPVTRGCPPDSRQSACRERLAGAVATRRSGMPAARATRASRACGARSFASIVLARVRSANSLRAWQSPIAAEALEQALADRVEFAACRSGDASAGQCFRDDVFARACFASSATLHPASFLITFGEAISVQGGFVVVFIAVQWVCVAATFHMSSSVEDSEPAAQNAPTSAWYVAALRGGVHWRRTSTLSDVLEPSRRSRLTAIAPWGRLAARDGRGVRSGVQCLQTAASVALPIGAATRHPHAAALARVVR